MEILLDNLHVLKVKFLIVCKMQGFGHLSSDIGQL